MKLIGVLLSTLVVGALSLSDYARNNIRHHFGSDRLIAVDVSKLTSNVDFGKLSLELDFDRLGSMGSVHHFKVKEESIEVLAKNNVAFDDMTEEFLTNTERRMQEEAPFFCNGTAEECASLPAEEFHAGYQGLDAIHLRFEKIAKKHRWFTRLEDFGTTYEGRTQKALWIADRPWKPLVFYMCAIHSREWITPHFCTHMAETLLDWRNRDSRRLLWRYSFVIVPVANPDGFLYSHEVNPAWRKTTKPNPLAPACNGTDPNRNYGYAWGTTGASASPCSDTYRGQSAFDQPCVNNIRLFAEKHVDRLVQVMDVHSYGEYLLTPWSYTSELPADDDLSRHLTCAEAVREAILDTSGLNFTVGPGGDALYLASGVSSDYFYGSLGITHSYTYEARGGNLTGLAGFQPPVENIIPSNEELHAGMVASLDCLWDVEFKNPLPTIAPSPTPPPTTFPTFGCGDLVPSGLTWSNGTAVECSELADFCEDFTVVIGQCPGTCGVCDGDVSLSQLNIKTVDYLDSQFGKLVINPSGDESQSASSSSFQVSVGLGVALAAMFGIALVAIAAFVVYRTR